MNRIFRVGDIYTFPEKTGEQRWMCVRIDEQGPAFRAWARHRLLPCVADFIEAVGGRIWFRGEEK